MPPAYASYAPAQTSPFPVSTFVLLIVSVISLIATGIIGIPSAIVSVVAWRQNATDPAACRKRTTTGWIVYAVNFVLGLPLLIWFYVWALSNQ
jgi:DMSO reductase anchor subunit